MIRDLQIKLALDDSEWTERYYVEPAFGTLGDTVAAMLDERLRLLCEPAKVVFIRGLDIAHPRRPVLRTVNMMGRRRIFDNLAESLPDSNKVQANHAELCACMGFETADNSRRTLHLGGIDTNEQKPPGDLSLIPAFLGDRKRPRRHYRISIGQAVALDRFRDFLLSDKMRLRIKHIERAEDAFIGDVSAVEVAPNGLYRIRTRDDFPAGVRDQVRFLGTRGDNLSRARGLRRITDAVDARTFILDRGPLPEGGPVRYTGGATLQSVNYVYSPCVWRALGDSGFATGELFIAPWPWAVYRITGQPEVYPVVSIHRAGALRTKRGRASARRR